MIFVTTSQRGDTNSELFGPFQSIEEGKKKVVGKRDRGYDGDETRFTFFEVQKSGYHKTLGYVLFRDEFEYEGEELKKEHFRDKPSV